MLVRDWVIDPVDGSFWAANEVVILDSSVPAVGLANWSTHISQFIIPERTGDMANRTVYFDTGSFNLADVDVNLVVLDAVIDRLSRSERSRS